MDFRILGPLDVLDGRRPVPIGAGKERALLALLLLRCNEVLATDRIVDELWGERPPATVAKALQVYVSRLRKALGAERIVTRAPGYALVVAPDELDADRFERLCERAGGADPPGAAELLRAALELWRGDPLADLAYEAFAQPEIARLTEARLGALEDRIDADLAIGRAGELVGELEELVARHPLRERLRYHLMLALYRSDRQADALEAYAAARATLVDELGIEPGAVLQELQARILRQDPALGPATERFPAPTPHPPTPDDERRLVTVVYADLAAEDEADPEAVSAALVAAQQAAAAGLEEAGGRVEWRAAGAMLATFGAAAAVEDHAVRALAAALQLRDATVGVALRLGVESGDVLVGSEVAGRPLDVARRLAATAGPGEVLAGERAVTAANGAFALQPSGGAWLVVAPDVAGVGRGRGFGRTFVGRETELALLTGTFERVARDRRPHVVSVVGEAGVGKTSLVAALRAAVGRDARWFAGRCQPPGRTQPYLAMAEILSAQLGIAPGAPPDAIRAALGERDILLLAFGLPGPEHLHPYEARERLREACVELLEEAVAAGPTTVLVEDLHWAEEGLVDLVERVARDVEGPLLLLTTARPDASTVTGRRDATRVWLEPLSRDETDRMIVALAGDVPGEVRAAVAGRAEGNPFFVEEILQALVDEGLMRQAGDVWIADPLPASVPAGDSVQSVIAARIDRLPDPDRAALQAAAVIGRSFWRGAVADALDRPRLALDVLEERDFVRRAPRSSITGEREFTFKHALTREIAYRSLSSPRRARLHAAAGAWLERVAGGDELAAVIGRHFAEAQDPARHDEAWAGQERRTEGIRASAVRWLRRGADLAYGRYGMEEARGLYLQAAELEPDAARRAGLLAAAAQAAMHRFDTDAFRADMERAIATVPSPAERAALLADLAIEGGQPYMWRSPPAPDEVAAWSQAALEHAADARTRATALLAAGFLDPLGAERAAHEGLALAGELADPDVQVRAYGLMTHVAAAAGRTDEAREWTERVLGLLPAVHDPDRRAGGLLNAVFALLRAGLIERGRGIAEQLDDPALRLTPHHEVHAVACRMLVATIRCDDKAALALTDRAARCAAQNLDTPCQFNWRTPLMAALAASRVGREDEARRLEERGLELAPPSAVLAREPALLRLALARGDHDAAQRLLAADTGDNRWDVDLPAARLDALVALDDREAAEHAATEALAIGGYVEPFALRALGTVRGDRVLLQRAVARFDALGLTWHAARTRDATPL